MMSTWTAILEYLASSKAQACELAVSPYLCEFWPLSEIDRYNAEYEVERFAPGYRGFATSGGGEMFALSPNGQVVCLPFIGMAPSVAIELAPSWAAFLGMLRSAA